MSKKPVSKKPTKPRQLDEKTSALVIAEYLALTNVKTSEVNKVMHSSRALSYREIAIAFRMSEVLDVRYPFELAPRFRVAYALARAAMRAVQGETEDRVPGTQTAVQS